MRERESVLASKWVYVWVVLRVHKFMRTRRPHNSTAKQTEVTKNTHRLNKARCSICCSHSQNSIYQSKNTIEQKNLLYALFVCW